MDQAQPIHFQKAALQNRRQDRKEEQKPKQ
jgi:hypothetical protein